MRNKNITMNDTTTSLNKYYKVFFLSYGFLSLTCYTLKFFKIDIPSYIFIITFILISEMTRRLFSKDYNRRPNKREKRKLVWRNIFHITLLDVSLTIIMTALKGIPKEDNSKFTEFFSSSLAASVAVIAGIFIILAMVFLYEFMILSIVFRTGKQKEEADTATPIEEST